MEFVLQPWELGQDIYQLNDIGDNYACIHNHVAQCGCIHNTIAGCACPQE
jgi:hypothetical protein